MLDTIILNYVSKSGLNLSNVYAVMDNCSFFYHNVEIDGVINTKRDAELTIKVYGDKQSYINNTPCIDTLTYTVAYDESLTLAQTWDAFVDKEFN